MIVYASLATITVLPVLLVKFCEFNRTLMSASHSSALGSSLLMPVNEGQAGGDRRREVKKRWICCPWCGEISREEENELSGDNQSENHHQC